MKQLYLSAKLKKEMYWNTQNTVFFEVWSLIVPFDNLHSISDPITSLIEMEMDINTLNLRLKVREWLKSM